MPALGDKLRQLRGESTLQTVATALDVNTSVISKYERGERVPVPAMLKRLAEFYGVPYDELNDLACDEMFSDDLLRESVLRWADRVLNNKR